MTIKVVLDKKGQLFIRGLRRRVRTDIPKLGLDMARILRGNIEKQINIFAKNPTGALARSFDIRVRTSPSGNISTRMNSDLPYALIHETGGRAGRNLAAFIRPKKYLTKALDRSLSGLQKLTTRRLERVVQTAAKV